MPKRWDTRRAALAGAVIGLAFAIYNTVIPELGAGKDDWPYIAGSMIGGTAAGAFMFAIVATVRNFFVR